MYISARGNGGWTGGKLGTHIIGGPSAQKFTKQENSDIDNIKGKYKKDAPPGQLYNLEKDPFQKRNLYNEFPKIVTKMKADLAEKVKSERTAPAK